MEWKLFWRLWFQKLLRNIASMKFQWLILLYIPTIYGMFTLRENGEPWISAVVGLSFFGGGFITLATSRIIAKTSFVEDDEKNYTLNTDK